MAELPKPQDRKMVLIPPVVAAPPSTLGFEPPSTPMANDSLEITSPEDALARFKDLGTKAKRGSKLPLDASKVAKALQTLSVPHVATAPSSMETYHRQLQFPVEIHDAMLAMVDKKRDIPTFVRDAIMSIAQNRVMPKRLIDQANEITRARRVGKGKVNVGIYMDKQVYGIVEVLSTRTKLTDKAVMEACTVLYLQAVLEAQKA
jgi:hypothetical protein